MRSTMAWLATLLLAPCAAAQDLVVYDDAGRNGFNPGFSYGGGTDVAHATTVHSGALSIAFTGNATFNAVAFARVGVADLTTAQYPTLRLFVHGGTAGGQQLRLFVQRDSETASTVVAQGELDPYIEGGAVAANAWREVTVPLAAFGVSGGFDRIDIQSDTGTQPVLYFDDIVLVAPAAQPDPIFLDGFEGAAPAPAGTLQFTPASPDASVGENAGTATFTVSRTGGSNGAVGATITLGGSAVSPADYSVSTTTLTWANGDTANKTVTITVVDDAGDEPAETVTLQLGAPTGGATLGSPSSATLTILDNDDAPSAGTLQFMASPDRSVSETAGTVTFNVTRSGGSAGAVGTTVSLGGTATNPGDYGNSTLALSWAAGDTATKTVTFTLVADLVEEPVETVTLQLGAPTGGATLGAPSSATLTIADAELLYAPRYGASTVRVYRREPGGFVERANAALPAGTSPNALAFARDGKLWVVNEGGTLQRYARSQVLAGGSPVPEATITVPAPNAGCCLIDLAFFGDFAYVTRTNFAGTNQVLKFPVSALAASGSPAPTVLTNASLNVPAGLEFDPQGRLWVSNFGSNTLVRIDTGTGVADRTGTNVATPNARNALNQPEGLSFDAQGTLWVGNNGEPTISAYTAAQLDALGATAPAHQIDVNPALGGIGNMLGGLAFDGTGRLWANYQQTFEILEYAVTPNGGGYTSAIGQRLGAVSTQPGFGGIAFWPVPATLYREGGGAVVANLAAAQNVDVAGQMADRYTWIDADGTPRSAALAHNDKGQGPTSAGGYPNHGGAMREYTFTMPGGATRTATHTTYGNGGQGGFGYVVSHPANDCGAGDSSPLGYGTPGTFQRLATGRHHAIFRFTQQYPRLCNAAGMLDPATYAVTIDWFFATGRDHPLWAVTFDLSALAANDYFDDARAPYGELNIDGVGAADISGTAWGDRYRFTSTTAPVSLSSAWSYVGLNSIPYVKLWITSTDATMGIVQTQTIDQHDAGAGRNRFVYDLRDFWNETSAGNPAGPGYAMPDQNYWAYQANSFSVGVGAPSNNARLTWGTNYGFLGQQSYESNHTLPAGANTSNASGYPKQSYSTYIVLDAHSSGAVEAQVSEMIAVQVTVFTASTGTVRTQGPAGPGREAENASYAPAGWDHVYGVWTVETNTNAATVNFNIGLARMLRNPIVNVRNWQGTTLPATVSLNGVPLVQDVDYFPSIVDDANELLITLNRTLAGATNTLAVAQ